MTVQLTATIRQEHDWVHFVVLTWFTYRFIGPCMATTANSKLCMAIFRDDNRYLQVHNTSYEAITPVAESD